MLLVSKWEANEIYGSFSSRGKLGAAFVHQINSLKWSLIRTR